MIDRFLHDRPIVVWSSDWCTIRLSVRSAAQSADSAAQLNAHTRAMEKGCQKRALQQKTTDEYDPLW